MPRIHAYFENMYKAGNTLKELMKAGYTRVYLDMSGAYDYECSVEIAVGSNDDFCLSSLVAKSSGYLLDPHRPPIVNAGTAVSRLDHTGDLRLIRVKLVAVIDDAKKEAVEGIIKENEGRIFPTFIE